MFCMNCGKPLTPGENFCGECGSLIGHDRAVCGATVDDGPVTADRPESLSNMQARLPAVAADTVRWLLKETACIVLLVLAAWVYASPYLAVLNLRQAALEGNGRALKEGVDFPALRASLKQELGGQLSKHTGEEMRKDPNAFAALGSALVGGFVNLMIDQLVTPQAIASIVQGNRVEGTPDELSGTIERFTAKQTPSDANLLFELADAVAGNSEGYESLSRFCVHIFPPKSTAGITLVWLRSGLTSWRLSGIRLPDLDELATDSNGGAGGATTPPTPPPLLTELRGDLARRREYDLWLFRNVSHILHSDSKQGKILAYCMATVYGAEDWDSAPEKEYSLQPDGTVLVTSGKPPETREHRSREAQRREMEFKTGGGPVVQDCAGSLFWFGTWHDQPMPSDEKLLENAAKAKADLDEIDQMLDPRLLEGLPKLHAQAPPPSSVSPPPASPSPSHASPPPAAPSPAAPIAPSSSVPHTIPFALVGTVTNTTNPWRTITSQARMDFGQDGTCSLTISPPLIGSGACRITQYDQESGHIEISSTGSPNISWTGSFKEGIASGTYRVLGTGETGFFRLTKSSDFR